MAKKFGVGGGGDGFQVATMSNLNNSYSCFELSLVELGLGGVLPKILIKGFRHHRSTPLIVCLTPKVVHQRLSPTLL